MARANPLLGGVRPELDLMAEHKALMERFAAAAMAAQSAAAAVQQAASTTSTASKVSSKESSPAVSPKTSIRSSGTPEPPQNAPIDLSNKKSDDEDSNPDEDIEMEAEAHENSTEKLFKKKVVKSDLNRNVVAQSEEDEEDEELDVGENMSR